MITIKQRTRFRNPLKFLDNCKRAVSPELLEYIGDSGLQALAAYTPVDTGTTVRSWYYTIDQYKGHERIKFYNSNVVDGVPIAILLQYGHVTKNGGWVAGKDYINPAMNPVFDKGVRILHDNIMK